LLPVSQTIHIATFSLQAFLTWRDEALQIYSVFLCHSLQYFLRINRRQHPPQGGDFPSLLLQTFNSIPKHSPFGNQKTIMVRSREQPYLTR